VNDKKVPRTDAAGLRQRAEERIGKTGTAHITGTEDPLSLLHELQVHQVELEMQNAELRLTRDELEAVLEEYTDLYDFAPVGYFTFDHNGTISRVNLTGATLIGIERARLVGMNFGQFVTEEARPVFNAFLGKVFTSSDKEECELTLLENAETRLIVHMEGWVAKTGQKCRIAVIDITERKRAEEVLRLSKEAAEAFRRAEDAEETLRMAKAAAETYRQAKEAAEATAREKSQFLINMSHELRTPMTGILGLLQLALEEELAPVPREYLETTLSSARSLLRIFNDILDMAYLESGKLTIEAKPFSPKTCITEAVDIIAPEVRRKGLELAVTATEEVPDIVVGDQVRLRQVLINLIGNAVKFTEAGNVWVRVTAGKTVSGGKKEITFTVTDTGIGVPDKKKELLFRTFSQVDASLSRKYGGTGLGLSICREIVDLMGGTITFESEEGAGSSFSFTIPLETIVIESDSLSSTKLLSPEKTPSSLEENRMLRILLAEDDPVSRSVIGKMLQRANYTIDFAEDGLKVIEMWEQGGYDLVLMDVQMPGINGYEATRIIREKEREHGGHTTILAMTAHASKDDEKVCLSMGMDGFISKPIDFKLTLKVIEEFTRQAAAS
jgi:PAS domain S-box-containing protein